MTTPEEPFGPDTTSQSNPDDEFIALLLEKSELPNTAEEFRLPLQGARIAAPEAVALVLQYMTTGSELARAATARGFGTMLLAVNQYAKRTTMKPLDAHVYAYRENLEYYKNGLSSEDQMTLGWHFNNVASELGMNNIEVDAVIHHAVENCANGVPDNEDPDVYWRGVSALYIACRDITSYPNMGEQLDFIREAGSSDDTAVLVALAQERSTLSITELRAILEDQKTIYPGLHAGVI